jgi:hypothetical protein
VNASGWRKGLRVTGDGTGIVSYAGMALLRALADNAGLTAGLSKELASRRLLVHTAWRTLDEIARGEQALGILTSLCARLYGRRVAANRAARAVEVINGGEP